MTVKQMRDRLNEILGTETDAENIELFIVVDNEKIYIPNFPEMINEPEWGLEDACVINVD